MSLARKSMGVFATSWLTLPLNLLTSVFVVRSIGAEGKGFVKTIAENGEIVIISDIINDFKKAIDSKNINNEKAIDRRIEFIKVDINSKDEIIKIVNKV